MSKSVLRRIDKDFEKLIIIKQNDYSKAIRKPVTFVQATKILTADFNKSSNVVFYKKRGKRVLL